MYKNVSEKFKGTEGVLNRGRINKGYIVTPDNQTITKFVQNQFLIQNKCCYDGKIIGNVIAKNFECQIYNGKQYGLANKEIDVYTGLKYYDGTEEYVPWGKFIIDTYENVESSDYVSIKAMDYMIKFNPEYVDVNQYPCYFKDWVVNFVNYFDVELAQLTYELTEDIELDIYKKYYTRTQTEEGNYVYELVESPEEEDIGTYYEVSFGNLPNQNFYVEETPEIANHTGREILKSVAEMFGSFATIGRDNKLYFKLKEETDVKIEKSPTIHVLTKNEVYGPINVVVLKLGQVEGENITKRDEESIATNGENVIQIEDNMFLNSQEKREAAIDELFDRLKGYSYTDFTVEGNSLMYLDVGDGIKVSNTDDTYFDSILLNQTIYVPNTSKSNMSAPSESKAEEKYQFTEEQKQINLYTELRVNKVEGEITATTQKTQTIEDDLNNNYYDKTNINTLLQNAETGITNTFSEAGGNNIFRNTGLWFENDTISRDNAFDDSFVYCTYNPNTSNKTLNNVYPTSSDVTGYIRSQQMMEVNPVYEYNISVPELTYKHGDEILVYKTSLLELTADGSFQIENDAIVSHELSQGSNTLSFLPTTRNLVLLLENQNSSRNIQVGDNLSNVTIYSSIPDDFYESITTSSDVFVKTSTDNVLQTYAQLSKGIYYVGCNTVTGVESGAAPSMDKLFYIKNDMTNVSNESLTMSETFGVVTEINSESPTYQYLKIGSSTQLLITDAQTTLADLSIRIETNDNTYEFWEGPVVRGSNDKAANNNSMLLQDGILSQEQEVPNGNYSISFYYKKTNPLATTSVIINDVEYSLDSTEDKLFYTGEKDEETGEYITQPIVVEANHIQIKFVCDINNGVEVWDLMCNKGTVKLAYSQNENETTTETVNISKGITITSSNMETIFKANANGIRILTLQEEVIAYFTDKGLSTKELIVEDEASICGTLITQVDDQTWFTRL